MCIIYFLKLSGINLQNKMRVLASITLATCFLTLLDPVSICDAIGLKGGGFAGGAAGV